jgi:dolichol-phosphate mannosyltransferase
VVTSDGADLPKDVSKYFEKICQGHDCAFGNRFDASSTVTGYPPVKRVINRIVNVLLGWVAGADGYRDFTNGFKCYRRHVIDDMQPLETGQFNITIEMSLKAVLGGHSFAVVPNDWQQRDGGESSFQIVRLIRPYAATLLFCTCRNYLRKIRR